MMFRFLVAFNGPLSGCWQFVGLTWSRKDADLIASCWRHSVVFDLAEGWR